MNINYPARAFNLIGLGQEYYFSSFYSSKKGKTTTIFTRHLLFSDTHSSIYNTVFTPKYPHKILLDD